MDLEANVREDPTVSVRSLAQYRTTAGCFGPIAASSLEASAAAHPKERAVPGEWAVLDRMAAAEDKPGQDNPEGDSEKDILDPVVGIAAVAGDSHLG